MSCGLIFLAILVLFIAIAIGVPMAIKMKRTPSAPGSDAPSKPKVISENGDAMKWLVVPALLWTLFWSILFFLYPSAWSLMWRNQALFWIAQAIYAGLVIKGKNHVDLRGKPARPAYMGILGFVIGCLFFVAVWKEAAGTQTPASKSSTTQASNGPKRPTLPAITKTFVVQPDRVSIATIPAGYHVARTEGTENLVLRQTELSDHSCEWELETKEEKSVQVALRCEPDTQ